MKREENFLNGAQCTAGGNANKLAFRHGCQNCGLRVNIWAKFQESGQQSFDSLDIYEDLVTFVHRKDLSALWSCAPELSFPWAS